ncbi:hypothetical protein BDAP_001202 [Binucleata daphniae]
MPFATICKGKKNNYKLEYVFNVPNDLHENKLKILTNIWHYIQSANTPITREKLYKHLVSSDKTIQRSMMSELQKYIKVSIKEYKNTKGYEEEGGIVIKKM